MSVQPAHEFLCAHVEPLGFMERVLAPNTAAALCAVDRQGRCVYWSAAMERLGLVRASDVLGRPLAEVLPRFARDEERRRLREALSGRTVVHRAFVAEDGRQFDTSYTPLRDATDQVVTVAVVVWETGPTASEHLRADELSDRFQSMADAAPVLLWMSREDGLCTFFNQSWLTFTGRTQREEWGVGWAEGIHFEDFSRAMDTYADAFSRREVFEMEYRMRRADGEYRWILDRGVPRYRADGSFTGFIGSCVDITDRRRQEQELRRAVQAKDDFIGLVSHELRTPITALQLQIERLRRGGPGKLSPSQEDLVRRMVGSTERLTRLIESVLSFSRIERGRMKIDARGFVLEELVHSVVDEMRPAAEVKGLALRFTGAKGAPPLVSDPELLRIVLSNLVGNAIKFTDHGAVEVATQVCPTGHEIVVRDSGRGIPADAQARVFEAFEQVGAPRQKGTPGVGLGLALARSMTNALGGSIRLESQAGQGSVFTVTLPPSVAPVDEEAKSGRSIGA